MFSKSKINDPIDTKAEDSGSRPAAPAPAAPPRTGSPSPSAPAKPKAPPSILSSDLTVTGNLRTTGDIQVEGAVDGDIRAHLLTVGESATIRGEIVADDVVVNGRVVGRVRGVKVRLTSSAKVEGDIIHKTIAIESGAHFEGSVQRNDDPLSDGGKSAPVISSPPAGSTNGSEG
ncbi:protein CcmA, bactofilin family [Albimonas donghaensis]|uniref:Protein CcmA, bactofilin family n=1 Tax=Albimonas donghaensis TaxID=356660 RepID=A0A1H2SFM1_9RHOB|nr:polymer-forming cytoskeletal protein [Albimonas donghaensis]SDW30400.1 protein CcmA, bactofilin family [Albimonas donghaensis]